MKEVRDKYVHCAIMGDGMIGKTCLCESYHRKSFQRYQDATVFENYVLPIHIFGNNFVVDMFDSGGQRDYESLRSFTYKESEVLLLCFSTCDRETFASISDLWMPELKRHSKHSKQKRPVILVGTQIDLRVGNDDGEVATDEGVQKAKDIGADCYVECSARDHKGLKDVFQHIVFSALKSRKKRSSAFKNIVKKILRLLKR